MGFARQRSRWVELLVEGPPVEETLHRALLARARECPVHCWAPLRRTREPRRRQTPFPVARYTRTPASCWQRGWATRGRGVRRHEGFSGACVFSSSARQRRGALSRGEAERVIRRQRRATRQV